MEVGIGWLGVGVGALGTVLTFLLATLSVSRENRHGTSDDRRRAWLAAGFALIVTLAFWLVSRQRMAPYSPGQTLGLGFLIGGAAGVIAIYLALRFHVLGSAGSLRTGYLAVSSMAFFGLLGVSLAYLIFIDLPQYALMGFSIGAVMAAILYYYLQRVRTGFGVTLTELWALFAVSVAVAVILGVYHFDSVTTRTWWSLPILVATTLCIAGYLGAEIAMLTPLRNRAGASFALITAIAALLTLGLTAIYAWRILENWQLLYNAAVGFGIAVLIAWLVSGALRSVSASGGLEAAGAVVLLVVAFAVVTFTLWAGLGTAIGLLGAWIVVLPAAGLGAWGLQTDRSGAGASIIPYRTAVSALSLSLAILLFRLFVEQYRVDLRTIDLRVNYNFIGALIGAVLPFVFTSSMMRLQTLYGERRGRSSDVLALVGVALLGLFAAASPLLLFLIWGIKAAMGLLFGMVAAEAFVLLSGLPQMAAQEGEERSSITHYSTGLLVIGAQLTAVQFIKPLIDLELTRTNRIWILAAAVVVGVLWLLITGIVARRRGQ